MVNTHEEKRLERMTEDLISFCRKWGFWNAGEVAILTNGNLYTYDEQENKMWHGIKNVLCKENVNPSEYTTGLTELTDLDGKYIRKDYSGPEHIFDIVYTGAMYEFFCFHEYEVYGENISDEAWKYILEKTEFLQDDIDSEAYDYEDIIENYVKEFDDPDYSLWDPLVFDTWEEYRRFCGWAEADQMLNYERYDTYAEYLTEQEKWDAGTDVTAEDMYDVRKMPKDLLEEVKKICREKYRTRQVYLPKIYDAAKNEFDAIFDRYGFKYDFGFGWSIFCYRK